MNTHAITADITPAQRLVQIVAAGVARFEATLPPLMRERPQVEAVEQCPNLAISDDLQREICLNCPLPDCVGVANDQCPIRIEARRQWNQRKRGER